MKIFNLLIIFSILFLVTSLTAEAKTKPKATALPTAAQTAQPNKTAHAGKERLVIYPLYNNIPMKLRNLSNALETALIEGLQERYEIFAGDQVTEKARQVFAHESRVSETCDATVCMQNIAMAFVAELMGVTSITEQGGSYFITFNINNVLDNKAIYSKTLICKQCDEIQLVEKLKAVTASTEQTASLTPVRMEGEPEMIAIPGRNYEMGKYEVTQAQWKAVMGNNPSYFQNCGDNCPVENVSWNDIQTFLQKLNTKTGKNYCLPTEAEWEFACYGGNQTEYCGSNNIDVVAWYGSWLSDAQSGNSGNTTHPVGQKQANGYGLYDMSGNVTEWMSDCYYENCTGRVLLGGSWLHGPEFARTVFHDGSVPAAGHDRGFRLARTLP